jgi:hypothetical protein
MQLSHSSSDVPEAVPSAQVQARMNTPFLATLGRLSSSRKDLYLAANPDSQQDPSSRRDTSPTSQGHSSSAIASCCKRTCRLSFPASKVIALKAVVLGWFAALDLTQPGTNTFFGTVQLCASITALGLCCITLLLCQMNCRQAAQCCLSVALIASVSVGGCWGLLVIVALFSRLTRLCRLLVQPATTVGILQPLFLYGWRFFPQKRRKSSAVVVRLL